MPYIKRVCNDPIELLHQRINSLTELVQRTIAHSRPSLPVYDNSQLPPDLNDGEMWINSQDQNVYYQISGNVYQLNGTAT